MPGPNLLIGSGESLTTELPPPGGASSTKAYPYSLERARQRLLPQLQATIAALRMLPDMAKPRGEAASLVTVHPAFLSKWQIPSKVFAAAGLRGVGSKATEVEPEHDARVRMRPGPKLAADLYLSGTQRSFEDLMGLLMSDDTGKGHQLELRRIERIRLQDPSDRILHIDQANGEVAVEVVVHGDGHDEELIGALSNYARHCGADLQLNKRFMVDGLVFIPGMAAAEQLERLALFSAIRAIRKLPALRLHRPSMREHAAGPAPALPTAAAVNAEVKVLAFDGGIGVRDFDLWTSEQVPAALVRTHADYLAHGSEVTSALLFGSVAPGATELPQPYFKVEHHRVVGADDEADVDLYDCMRRIDSILKSAGAQFCNLSLGPRMFIDDDHPHAWTCMLDKHLAAGTCLATVAVGNDGDLDGEAGRIQPPADAVNALSVGAATSEDWMWDRAPYSCRGPGRSPGRVKPDGLAFGGAAGQPLVLLSPYMKGLCALAGTSYAAPLALRVAAGAVAITETKLSATALRALMIHKCESATGHQPTHVGWGRFPQSVDALLSCADNEATVLYQGYLAAGKPIRAKLPVPAVPLGTRLNIKATFCFASPVDPADSLNYTRHGLTVVFRPRGEGSTDEFFSASSQRSEDELRRDAHKWETILHRYRSFPAEQLLDACFDIQHGARAQGRAVKTKDVPPLPYVLIVTITSDTAEPVYNNVLQRYRSLQPIRLRTRVET